MHETLDGGQAFRWSGSDGIYTGQWDNVVVRLTRSESGLQVAFPVDLHLDECQRFTALDRYFALPTRFDQLADALPWRTDPVLAVSIDSFPQLRLLAQPFAETLFCFLCSSTKQIPQIKAICEFVACDQGKQLTSHHYALPTWVTLARNGEERLRQAKLGYRARYIYQCARILADQPDYFDRLNQLSTDEARAALTKLPGVGRKIADCTLLFGAGRLDAFPIDTWIEKILINSYGLDSWTSKQLQTFAKIHFGPAAGLAQQFLFSAARAKLIAQPIGS